MYSSQGICKSNSKQMIWNPSHVHLEKDAWKCADDNPRFSCHSVRRSKHDGSSVWLRDGFAPFPRLASLRIDLKGPFFPMVKAGEAGLLGLPFSPDCPLAHQGLGVQPSVEACSIGELKQPPLSFARRIKFCLFSCTQNVHGLRPFLELIKVRNWVNSGIFSNHFQQLGRTWHPWAVGRLGVARMVRLGIAQMDRSGIAFCRRLVAHACVLICLLAMYVYICSHAQACMRLFVLAGVYIA